MSKTSATSGSEELKHLLMRMSGKDEVAFDRLHACTKRKLFSIVLPIVGRRHLAEEVTQEAYVRIWQNAALYSPSLGSPMNWMITIARNLAIDFTRRPAHEIYFEDPALCNFPADGPTALEAIEIAEEQADAARKALSALQVLDPTRRQLIIAAYVHGESRKQLSERHCVPVNTIKTWIRRALQETRANFQAQAELRRHEEHPDRT
jgi:RNA polymerase sigma-70 factor (ECF subfamily)